MAYGFAGKILRVDLTSSTISEVPTSNYVPKYIGGRGIATRIYWEEIGPEVKALDPENKLIFMTGPLQGTAAPGSGRLTVVGKAAQTWPTESIADSNAGGFFAPELKFAGWDGIIIEGKAAKPVYIYIKDRQVFILDAGALWGFTTYAAQVEIWKKHGPEAKILVIGQAGEHLSRIASIQTESGNGMGQGGFGGVMGSKNLKAIAVRGTGSVEVARPDELLALKEDLRKLVSVRVGETVQGFQGKQMGMFLRGYPSKYLDSRVPGVKDSKMRDLEKLGLVKLGASGCDQCPIQCRSTMKFVDSSLPPCSAQCIEMGGYTVEEQNYYGGKPWGKVQYMLTLFNQLYGLNAFEVRGSIMGFLPGPVLDIMHKLANDGVLTNENTGWPLDKIGSQEFLETFLRDVAYAQGFGAIVAQGTCRMAEHIATHSEFGPNREKALTYIREVYPMAGNFGGYCNHHNTIMTAGAEYSTMLYWVVANRDPQTKHSDWEFYTAGQYFGWMGVVPESDLWYSMLKPMMMKWIGTDKPIEPPGYEDAELATRWWWQRNFETDCLQLCDWWQWPSIWTPWTKDGISDIEAGSKLLSAVTGENITQKELWAKCEVPRTLERAIACREGRRAKDDEYTDEFLAALYEPKGRKIDQAMMRALTDKFYALVGWNSDGVPTRARLEELDLKDVADDLEARGVI